MGQQESIIEKSNEMGICHSCLQRQAIADYNGEKYYVCRICLEDLSKKFKENQAVDQQFEMTNKIPSHKDLGKIVSIQVDINRAVWAGNLTDLNKTLFANESDRDNYIRKCIISAQKAISKL